MNRSIVGFTLLLTAIASMNAWSWGNQGHQAIGAMADQLIAGSRAQTEVKKLLENGETLESVAIWADCAKGYCGQLTPEMKAFIAANSQHHDYHFVDVPFELTAYSDGEVGTSDHDITKILAQWIAVLQDHSDASSNPNGFSKRQALLLLTHFVGDVHQPLHVGPAYVTEQNLFDAPPDAASVDNVTFASTQGDNFFILSTSKNLHSYWDTDLVEAAMSAVHARTPAQYANYLRMHFTAPPVSPGNPDTWPVLWVNDTLIAAKTAHQNVRLSSRQEIQDKGKDHYTWRATLSSVYPSKERGVAQDQVTKAGYRLAQLLKAIWPDSTPAKTTPM